MSLLPLLAKLLVIPKTIAAMLLSPVSAMSLYSLVFSFTMAFAFLAFRQKRRRGRVRLAAVAHAMRRQGILNHRSTLADLCYFVFGLLALGALLGWAVLSASAIANFVAEILRNHLGARSPLQAPDIALRAGMTVLLFLAYELGFFLDHTLKHRIPALWELHKTHHSAEVLTPLTNFRVHPLDSLILANNLAIVIGLISGVAQYLIAKPLDTFAFDGMNILMLAYIYLTAQLQHSQFWIPFRGAFGRLFMSPAHHQIHHSSDPAHFNRNMGASLALWDWLFGTLKIPEKEPLRLKFGVSDTDRDPHSVTTLLIDPIINSLSAVLGIKLPLPPAAAKDPSEDRPTNPESAAPAPPL